MLRKFLKISLLIFLILLPQATYRTAQAESARPGFGVSILPNQYQSEDLGYFDLSGLKPGEKTLLQLKVTNNSPNPLVFDAFANDAATNQNLIVDYSGELASHQKVTGPRFSQIAQPEQKTYTLAGYSTQTVNINVTMPETAFDGQIMGGIYLRKHLDSNQTGAIKNMFSYVNTVILRQGKQNLTSQPLLTSSSYQVNNTIPTVTANMENKVQAYASDMTIKQYLTDDKDKIIEESSQNFRAIAPRSSTNIYFKLDHLLSPGKYWIHLETAIDGHKVTSKQPFTVNAAKSVTAGVHTINNVLWYFLGLSLFFILLIIFLLWWFLIWKRRKKDDDKENEGDNKDKGLTS